MAHLEHEMRSKKQDRSSYKEIQKGAIATKLAFYWGQWRRCVPQSWVEF